MNIDIIDNNSHKDTIDFYVYCAIIVHDEKTLVLCI